MFPEVGMSFEDANLCRFYCTLRREREYMYNCTQKRQLREEKVLFRINYLEIECCLVVDYQTLLFMIDKLTTCTLLLTKDTITAKIDRNPIVSYNELAR